MNGLPLSDWQFWVATALAAAALWAIARPLLPRRGKKTPGCPGCPTAESADREQRPKHVDLTIEGRRIRN